MTSLSDAYKMRDLAFKLWGKKDISLSNNPPRQSRRSTGRCYKLRDRETGGCYYVIHLFQFSNVRTIAHEIAHAYSWDDGHGSFHREMANKLLEAFEAEKGEL